MRTAAASRHTSAACARCGCISLLSGGIAEQQLRSAAAAEVYADAAEPLEKLDDSAIGVLPT
jgi:hypothetical protein